MDMKGTSSIPEPLRGPCGIPAVAPRPLGGHCSDPDGSSSTTATATPTQKNFNELRPRLDRWSGNGTGAITPARTVDGRALAHAEKK